MIREVSKSLALLAVSVTLGAAQTPVARSYNAAWMQRHEDKLREIHSGEVGVVFIGDSITQELETDKSPRNGDLHGVWQRFYACRRAINLGFGGDTTANVLWRIENGEIDSISPKLAVILIGTNRGNPRDGNVEDQVGNIIGVVSEVHHRLPQTKLLVLGIPPNGLHGSQGASPAEVDASLARVNWAGYNATFFSTYDLFLTDDRINPMFFVNGSKGLMVHPNGEGWQKLAQSIEPTVERLLGDGDRRTSASSFCVLQPNTPD